MKMFALRKRLGVQIALLLIATLVTALMMAVSWYLAGSPGTNGIDDAAITRSYSENIADGHGSVYNIGGERVEGATSFLWTMLIAISYLIDGNVEFSILALTTCLTIAAVFLAMRLTTRAISDAPPIAVACLMAVVLVGLPGFFVWSVWSMMEIGLWTVLCLLLLDQLSELIEATDAPRHPHIFMFLAAVCLPLARPEGVAVAVGLLLLAICLRPRAFRPLLLAILLSLAAFAVLVFGRIAYFGYPFPNTYYAKVSADRTQSISEGVKYLIDFVITQPFAEIILVAWIIVLGASLRHGLKEMTPNSRTHILCAAFVFGILVSYVVLGGDHFTYWRFYQPIMPIFALPFVVALVWSFRNLNARFERAAIGFGTVILTGAWIILNNIHFFQSRFEVGGEYQLSKRGENFGTYMNSFAPRPVMGITAAGGIALTYDGELRDLLGLNWVEMAHANPIKQGFRNHASFDVATFWKHPPQIVPLYNRSTCQRDAWTERSGVGETGVKQLYIEPKFQQAYVPVILERDGGHCTNAFASNEWLTQVDDDRIVQVRWNDLIILGQRK